MLCALAVLASCASDGKKTGQSQQADQPVETLYNKAAGLLDQKKYKEASKAFEEVERQHPYSEWSTQAELMGAFASYSGGDYDESVVALERFIELHPGSPNIDYALYLKALNYYEQISDVRRDQEMTRNALESFDALIQRFPDSKYTRDATLKRDLTVDHLAGKEMTIGRYYQGQGEINAAINRYLAVVKNYQTTTHAQEALYRLVEAYTTLGLKAEATRIAAVLGYNYPGSVWYKRAYDILDDQSREKILDSRSFVDRSITSIFKAN